METIKMDIISNSVIDLANAIKAKELSSEEIVSAYIKQIEQINPKINAIVQLNAEDALNQAREADKLLVKGEILGPLHGVPMTIKDSLDTAGVITTWGTAGRKNYIPNEDATIVKRMKKAGAILLGKTNTPEFTLSYETDNQIYGRTNNPYNLERTPGGSSGGEAAIIASCGSPMGLGSDTGGSIRVPSHFCGLAGIKPTSGRVPRTGHAIPYGSLIDSFTQLGPIVRYVGDLGLILNIIAGPDNIDPFVVPMPLYRYEDVILEGLSCALLKNNGLAAPDEETISVLDSTVKVLTDAGLKVTEIEPSGMEKAFELYMGLSSWDGGDSIRLLLERAGTGTDKTSLGMWLSDARLSSMELLLLIEQWDSFRTNLLTSLKDYDLLLSPVNAFHTMPHGKFLENIVTFSYTMMHNISGWPAGVVRAGKSKEGLPIGMQVAAKPWREDIVLAALQQIEKITGGWQAPDFTSIKET